MLDRILKTKRNILKNKNFRKKINKNFVVLIPARKGSKRINNKNFISINKKPLIYYTYKETIKIFDKKNIFISSNDEKAKKFSIKYGLRFIERPQHLCKDNSSTEEAIRHFIKKMSLEKSFLKKNIILLQITSPLRTSKDIAGSIRKFNALNLDSIFSGFKEKGFAWISNGRKLKSISFDFKKRKRSQELADIVYENGSIFIFNIKKFLQYQNRICGKFDYYEMTKKVSIDIDEKKDLRILKRLI